MKKKYADLSKVKDVGETEFIKIDTPNDPFFGSVCLTTIKQALKDWNVPRDNGTKEQILGENYKWINMYPKEANFCLIAIFNDKSEFVEFYFDIAKKVNYKPSVPYTEDLYLDIVITKENDVIFLDENELEEALKLSDIKQKDYELARKTADKIVNKYHKPEEFEKMKKIASDYLDILKIKSMEQER